jgi:hypothetical protein
MKLPIEFLMLFPNIDYNIHKDYPDPQYRVRRHCSDCQDYVFISRLRIYEPWKYLGGVARTRLLDRAKKWVWEEWDGIVEFNQFYSDYFFCPNCLYIFQERDSLLDSYCDKDSPPFYDHER